MKERGSERIEFINSAGELFDLSCTGAGFFSTSAIKSDELITIQINDLKLLSKVVYCQDRSDGFRVGLQFQNMAEQDKHGISELVEGFSKGVPITFKIIEEYSAKPEK
jgi:hypothetical protein